MPKTFSQPLMYWVGADSSATDATEIAEFNQHYNYVHMPEVVAGNAGFVAGHRYELEDAGAGESSVPQYFVAYEMENEAAAQLYIVKNDTPHDTPGIERPRYTAGPAVWSQKTTFTWRMIWRKVAESSVGDSDADRIVLVGVEPPEGSDEATTAECEEYFRTAGYAETLADASILRSTGHELRREFRHPEPGCPRFLAIHESNAGAGELKPPSGASTSDSGPESWRQRKTVWSAVYRRIRVD